MTSHRRTRVTIRCLCDDLGLAVPCLDTDIGEVQHFVLEEARRLAQTSPAGQKLIKSISTSDAMIYRLRQGRWRGATWVELRTDIVWLLAAAEREEGSSDDAYEYFERLHRNGALLPSDDDRDRDRYEEGLRFIRRVADEAPRCIEEAWVHPGDEIHKTIGGRLEILLYSEPPADIGELWLAVARQYSDGEFVSPRARDEVFALFEQAVGDAEWEEVDSSNWPTRQLAWEWVARLYVHE